MANEDDVARRIAEWEASVRVTEGHLVALDDQHNRFGGNPDLWRSMLRGHLQLLHQHIASLKRPPLVVSDRSGADRKATPAGSDPVLDRISAKLDYIVEWIRSQPQRPRPEEG